MIDPALSGLDILVVEDEYLLADDLRAMLSQAGARVAGPFAAVAHAAEWLDRGAAVDFALLDINLGGSLIFDLVARLRAATVPIAFLTGYSHSAIPDIYADIPVLDKAVLLGTPDRLMARIVEELGRVVA
ncbi:response regulator [Sphingomonas abaci]|uniref:CheY-like chemotaxis protein n=1 Tax=Sphingomonas abaci TaxID=237611 RepID=A0A7W7AJ55_9SPHN|nr:response regulator [Sphingomonas abaci]MBB4616992.1 CheY-like chemotaxis protein [Sphingomonas abaci]